MEKNNIIITALCIITPISLSSCIEDGDMEDFKENNNAVANMFLMITKLVRTYHLPWEYLVLS